ncbi:MAG: tetratricopeptide repeat protein [Acidobacteria bacterium]|nr:tetratricopeptide repeat protein [Acidobacteriota bacterium]
MGTKQITTGVVGIVIGFIMGFFASQIFLQNPSRVGEQQPLTSSQDSSQLPAEHPPAEVMEKLTELQDWAQTHPQDSQVRINLANTYYDMGRFDGALSWYEEALQLEPDNVDVRTDLGTAYLYTGNPIKAVEHYKSSLEMNPDHIQTLQNISVAYLSTGNYSEAIGHLERLLQSHPDYPQRKEIEQQIEYIRTQILGGGPP